MFALFSFRVFLQPMQEYFHDIFNNIFQVFLLFWSHTSLTTYVLIVGHLFLLDGLFYLHELTVYFYTFSEIFQVELIFNFNDLVLEVYKGCFEQFVLVDFAQIVYNINPLSFWMFIFHDLQFIFVVNPIVIEVELFRLGLYICVIKLIATDDCNFILLHLFQKYYKPNIKTPSVNRIFIFSLIIHFSPYFHLIELFPLFPSPIISFPWINKNIFFF